MNFSCGWCTRGFAAHLANARRRNLAGSRAPILLSSRPFGSEDASHRTAPGIVRVKRSTQIFMRAGRALGRAFRHPDLPAVYGRRPGRAEICCLQRSPTDLRRCECNVGKCDVAPRQCVVYLSGSEHLFLIHCIAVVSLKFIYSINCSDKRSKYEHKSIILIPGMQRYIAFDDALMRQ